MSAGMDRFLKIDEKEREEHRLYFNEALVKYFDEIMHRLIDNDSEEMRGIYERHPLSWAISEEPDKVNACFSPSWYQPYFCIWRELINMLDNEDQLAYIMGHELEHYYQDMMSRELKNKGDTNSHAEEASADVKSILRMAKAGYNIGAAGDVVEKLQTLAQEAREKGNKRRASTLEQYIRVLDPHPEDNLRTTINEVAIRVARGNLAAGQYNGKEVDANTIPHTPLSPVIHETDYISYVDKAFQDAHFDEMSVEEKNKFLVRMCVEVAKSEREVREIDFIKQVQKYKKSLENEMLGWSEEETKRRFADGSAPAMSLIEEYLKNVYLRPGINEELLKDCDSLYKRTIANILDLWPDSVKFEGNAEFWQGLRDKIEACLDRAKRRHEDNHKMTKDEREKVDEEDQQDSDFISRLKWLFSSNYGARGIERWKDIPTWDSVKLGDRYPKGWISYSDRKNIPVKFYHWTSKLQNITILRKYYDDFIINPDYSICACKVVNPETRETSDTIDRVWANEVEYFNWQTKILMEELHKQIADELHNLKKRADAFIEGKEESEYGDVGELVTELFPAIPAEQGDVTFRALSLEDISDALPDWKYLPRIWLRDFNEKLEPYKLDRDLLMSKMTPEDVEFYTHPQIEYADKFVDAMIDRVALKKERKRFREAAEYYPFPSLTGLHFVHEGIVYKFLPYQQEKFIEGYIKKAPPREENVTMYNEHDILSVYVNLFRYYFLKQGEKLDADFKEFQSPLPDYVLKCFKLPEFSYKNTAAWEEFIKNRPEHDKKKDIPASLQMAVYDSILHEKNKKVSLKLLNELMIKNGRFEELRKMVDIFDRKLSKLCQNKENWPDSLADFSEVVYWFRRARKIGQYEYDNPEVYAVIKNEFIERLKKESDPKKIEEAWLLAGDYLSLDVPDSKEYDDTMVPILKNSPMWNRDLKSKIELFKKIPDHFWGSDCAAVDTFLGNILDEVNQIKDPHKREELLFEFVKKDGRPASPELLDRVEHMWVKSVADIMGKEDDDSDEYLAKIKPYIEKIKKVAKTADKEEEKNTVLEVDRRSILRYLAEEVVSQKRLSQQLKPDQISLENQTGWEKTKESLAIIGAGGFGVYLQNHPEKREDIIDFLRSKGTVEDCRKLRLALQPKFDDPEAFLSNRLKYELSISRIQRQYKAFWSATPEIQTLIVDKILKDTNQNESAKTPMWEQNFNYVAEQIFPGDTQQSKTLKTALHAYISSRPKDERSLALAKLLVASGIKTDASNEEEANQKIGKGIKIFLESIGPAGIKLGQALSAVPGIPNYVRDNLKEFTSNVARPARWEIYDWLDLYAEQNPEEKDLIDSLKLGKILGSASFFVTLDSDNGDVVKCLRSAAKVKAEQEMGYIYKALLKLSKEDKQILGDLGPTLKRIVKQAQDSIAVETDLEIGKEQFEVAKELYPEEVSANGIVFNIKEAAWREPHGKKWARLEKMHGVEIDKIQDPAYKKAASIAYFSVELLNIFSGGKFDFDRHIGQMKIDADSNTLGLFDTGSMLLEKPTQEDQRALGTILYRTLENALAKPGDKSFAAALTEEIDRFYEKTKQPSPYITQVQRGLLALSGYYKDFSVSDFAQSIDIAFNNPQVKVSDHIMSAFVGEMLNKSGLLASQGLDGAAPEEAAGQKESLGRLLFNMYAAAQAPGAQENLGEILEEESKFQKDAKMPILGRLFFKKKGAGKSKNEFEDIKVPACFGMHIVDALKDKKVDPIIVKGMMKEGFESVCLMDKNHRDTPQTKRELGKQLYGLFVVAKRRGKSQEEIKKQMQQSLQVLAEKSVLARNLYAILSLSDNVTSEQEIDLKEVAWEIISQKEMDQDVIRGIQSAMRENGQTLGSLALHFRRPLSKIRKIRSVFSLFKKGAPENVSEKVGLRGLFEKAQEKIAVLPQKVGIEKTEKGGVLRLFKETSKEVKVPLAGENKAIRYGKKRPSSDKRES